MTTHKKDDDVTTSDLSTSISSWSRALSFDILIVVSTPPIIKLILLLLLVFPWSRHVSRLCRIRMYSGQNSADQSNGK